MKKIIFTQTEQEDILNLYYKDKLSIANIANKFNVSYTAILNLFKENNWERRKTYEHFIKYSVDDYYFDNIDTPDKAYCIGLLYSDGCNHYKKHDISIELQSRDKFVLDRFNELTQNTRPLLFCDASKYTNRTKDTYKMLIHSQHMCETLNNLGVVPCKSLILDFPQWITLDLFPYMLRGYFDGDGWIQKYTIGFMSTDKFCYGVQTYLKENYNIESHVMDMKGHYKKETKTLYIQNRKNIKPLINLMYAEGSIYIPRKLDKCIEYNFLDINNSLIA